MSSELLMSKSFSAKRTSGAAVGKNNVLCSLSCPRLLFLLWFLHSGHFATGKKTFVSLFCFTTESSVIV